MTIPYRCMLPLNNEGLLVAGRCVSAVAPVANCIDVCLNVWLWEKQQELQLLSLLNRGPHHEMWI